MDTGSCVSMGGDGQVKPPETSRGPRTPTELCSLGTEMLLITRGCGAGSEDFLQFNPFLHDPAFLTLRRLSQLLGPGVMERSSPGLLGSDCPQGLAHQEKLQGRQRKLLWEGKPPLDTLI